MSFQYQYQVIHGTYTPTGTEAYILLALGAPGGVWAGPSNFPSLISQLSLQAANNLAVDQNGNYVQFAYIVGASAGMYSTSALAKAAAQADYAAIQAAKAALIESMALLNPLGSPYFVQATDSPVSGPG